MASRAILSNSFEEHELKTTHNTFRDSRAHFFPTTFLKIAVYTKENGAFRTKEAFLGYLAYFAQLIKTGKEKTLGEDRFRPGFLMLLPNVIEAYIGD